MLLIPMPRQPLTNNGENNNRGCVMNKPERFKREWLREHEQRQDDVEKELERELIVDEQGQFLFPFMGRER